jgi:spore coat protein U-like protein
MKHLTWFCPAMMSVMVLLSARVGWTLGCTTRATPIAFGIYQPLLGTDAVSVSTITYTCSGVKGRVRIGLSSGDSGSFNARVMNQEGKKLEYNLYLDPTGLSVWGDGTGGSQVYTANNPADGAVVNLIVYGRVQAGQQAVTAGIYHDSVSVFIDP